MKARLQFDIMKGRHANWPRFKTTRKSWLAGNLSPRRRRVAHRLHGAGGLDPLDYGLSELDAYQLLSQVGKVHVTEMVDPNYVVIASIEKRYLPAKK